MDWEGVIEKNREALKRIVAALVAMAGLRAADALPSPLKGGSPRSGGVRGVPTRRHLFV